MSAAHTPGPWNWDSDPIKGDPLGRVRYRVVAIGKTVTQCYYSSSDEQAEWDARLIAAAPDLLEALCGLLACPYDIDAATVNPRGLEATMERNSNQVVGHMSVALARVRMARAAIAKATGQNPSTS